MKDKVLEQCLLIVLEHLQEKGTSAMVGTLEQAIKEIERLESKNNDIDEPITEIDRTGTHVVTNVPINSSKE